MAAVAKKLSIPKLSPAAVSTFLFFVFYVLFVIFETLRVLSIVIKI